MKLVHKTARKPVKFELHPPLTVCGIYESADKNGELVWWHQRWARVTCKKCLAKRPL